MHIEFCGKLSDACIIDGVKRRARVFGFISLIATIIGSAIAITVGVYNGTWPYALILIAFFVAGTIFSFIPQKKRALSLNMPSQLIVDYRTISITALGGASMTTKSLQKVKKVIDAGGWYYIIFKYGDITNAWGCEKDLIVKGTLEEFEKVFEGKIIREK